MPWPTASSSCSTAPGAAPHRQSCDQ
jgi:hypothetical protein